MSASCCLKFYRDFLDDRDVRGGGSSSNIAVRVLCCFPPGVQASPGTCCGKKLDRLPRIEEALGDGDVVDDVILARCIADKKVGLLAVSPSRHFLLSGMKKCRAFA